MNFFKYSIDKLFYSSIIFFSLLLLLLMFIFPDIFVVSSNSAIPYGLYRTLNILFAIPLSIITIIYFNMENKTSIRSLTLLASKCIINKFIIFKSISWIIFNTINLLILSLIGLGIYTSQFNNISISSIFLITILNILIPVLFLILISISLSLIIKDSQTVILLFIGYFIIFEFCFLVLVIHSPLLLSHLAFDEFQKLNPNKLIYCISGIISIVFAYIYTSRE